MTVILGIKAANRNETAEEIQKILTQNGCYIKTRLGIHNILSDICPQNGLILLEIPQKEHAITVENELLNVSEIEIQRMEFDI